MAKRPAFQFYPGDWLRDTALRSCSVGARGLWIDMLCLMHEGSPYGYLKVGEKIILPKTLAKMVGASLKQVETWLIELKNANVFSISGENNCIFSRRMVKDEIVRTKRAEGGKLGGNPALKSNNGSDNVENKDNHPPNLKPTPSSAVAFAFASSNHSPSSVEVDSEPEAPPEAEIHTLGKFPIRLDWKPKPEILKGVLFRAGKPENLITPAAVANFVEFWAQEHSVNTETQWCQKLLASAQKFALQQAPAGSRRQSQSLDEIIDILRSGLPPEEDDHEQSA